MSKKYIHTLTTCVMVFAVFATALSHSVNAAPTTAGSIAKVKNLELISSDGGVRVRVHTGSKIPFTHQIVPPKDGKPYRIILDCQDADHLLGGNKFSALPNSVISRIRTSQFSVKPQHMMRVVLDLKREAFYRVEQTGNYIDLFITDRSARRFSTWSSATVVAERKKAKAAKEVDAKPTVTVANVAPEAKSVSAPVLAVSAPVKSEPAKAKQVAKPVAKSEVKAKVAPSVSKPAAAKVAKKDKVQQEKKPAVKSVTVAKAKPVPAKSAPSVVVAQAQPAVKKAPVKNAEPKVAQKAAKSVAENTVTKKQEKAKPAAAKPQVTLAKAEPAKKLNKKAPAKKELPAKKSAVVSKVAPAKSVTVAKATSEKGAKKQSAPESKVESGASLFASTANAAGDAQAEQPNTVDQKGYSATFRRSAVEKRRAKLKGTQVAQFPKRLTIKYKSKGTRDPFESLFEDKSKDDNGMTIGLPNVEALAMVGTLKDVKGQTRGLFEDIDGRGYILAKGDKVRNGTVLKITEQKAYFQIFEYGWSRTVALSFDG